MLSNGLRLTTAWLTFAVVGCLVACGQRSESYHPLDEGRTWEYEVVVKRGGSSGTGTAVQTNLEKRKLNDQRVTPQRTTVKDISTVEFYTEDRSGVLLLGEQKANAEQPEILGSPEYVLKFPLEVGESWTRPSKLALVGDAKFEVTNTIEGTDETVTVPAGTFEGCVKIRSVGSAKQNVPSVDFIRGPTTKGIDVAVEGFAWYAPGVGEVKKILREESQSFQLREGEMTIQLRSYTE